MNPYENLPERAFWRTAVATRSIFEIENLWTPKFSLSPATAISTFGSCFAQHIGRGLRDRGYGWLSTEPPPPGLSEAGTRAFNYDIFTCRTGNIYTTSMLRQWTSWATGASHPPTEYWQDGDGRYVDPIRPSIEPSGFVSLDELHASRSEAISAFLRAITKSDIFIFTLGLTESWRNSELDYEYQICPGVKHGEFDAAVHQFRNHDYSSVRSNLEQALEMMRSVNPELNIILTVSPVALTATMAGRHVLSATTHSKSVLRAVAGDLSTHSEFVDYFPSYEIIQSPTSRGIFFKPNQRQVERSGVDFVMSHFLSSFGNEDRQQTGRPTHPQSQSEDVCDEVLLDAFGRPS